MDIYTYTYTHTYIHTYKSYGVSGFALNTYIIRHDFRSTLTAGIGLARDLPHALWFPRFSCAPTTNTHLYINITYTYMYMYICIFTHKHTLVQRTQETRGHALFLLLTNNYSRALSTSFVSFAVSFSHSSNVLSSPSCSLRPSLPPTQLMLLFSFFLIHLCTDRVVAFSFFFFTRALFTHTH